MDIKKKLEECFNRLQTLDIQPTENNMEKLLKTLYDLKEIYREMEKEEEADGDGQAADSE